MTDHTEPLPEGDYLMTARVTVHPDGYLLPHDTAAMYMPEWWIKQGAVFTPEPEVPSPAADLRSMLLDQLGYVDGAEVTASGSADNDLAAERADVVLRFIALVRVSSWPKALLPTLGANLCDGTTTCTSDAHVEGCMAMVPDGSESAAPCDQPVVAGTGRCDRHQCNGDWTCPAEVHAADCMVLPAEVLNAPIHFWQCPIRKHREREEDIVEWRGGVAHCTMPGCAQTSQARRWRDGAAEPADHPSVFDGDGIPLKYNAAAGMWYAPDRILGHTWLGLLQRGPLTEDLSSTAEPDNARRCTAQIWPSWAPAWVTCNSVIRAGKCLQYDHREETKPRPADVPATPAPLSSRPIAAVADCDGTGDCIELTEHHPHCLRQWLTDAELANGVVPPREELEARRQLYIENTGHRATAVPVRVYLDKANGVTYRTPGVTALIELYNSQMGQWQATFWESLEVLAANRGPLTEVQP